MTMSLLCRKALLSQWAIVNGFKIDTSKCHSMIFSRKHRRSEVISVNFLLNGDLILPQTSVKYLGVLVDQDLTWSLQVGHVRKKVWLLWLPFIE